MRTFEITLKNEKEKTYRFIILLFVLIHVSLFVYLLFDESWRKKAIVGLVLILIYSGYRLLITNTKHHEFSFGSGFFYLFAIASISFTWLAAIDLVLGLLSQAALERTLFQFNPSQIEKRNFPFKKYNWDQFSNVVLKDNLLTLDFKTNKLLQGEIETTKFNEEAFNTFAKEHLNKI